jgi:RNA polymerase sigma factor (sigma-70 family)
MTPRDDSLRRALLATLHQVRGFATEAEARALKVAPPNEKDDLPPSLTAEAGSLGPGLTELVTLNTGTQACEHAFVELERLEYRLLVELFALGLARTALDTIPPVVDELTADCAVDIDDPEEPDGAEDVGIDAPGSLDPAEVEPAERAPVHEWLQEREALLSHPDSLTTPRIDRWRLDPQSPTRRRIVEAILAARDKLPNVTLDGDRHTDIGLQLLEWQRIQGEIVVQNIRLALFHARRSRGALSDREALLSGVVGLQTATRRFEVTRGYKFSTYASYWVMHAIRRASADFGHGIRTPVHDLDRKQRLLKAAAHLDAANLAKMSAAEIGARLNVDAQDVRAVQALVRPVRVHSAVGEIPPMAHVFDNERLRPSEASPSLQTGSLLEKERRLRAALEAILPNASHAPRTAADRVRLHEILLCRLELGSDRFTTLKELGERYGISRERIRQLESDGLEQLHKLIQKMPAS